MSTISRKFRKSTRKSTRKSRKSKKKLIQKSNILYTVVSYENMGRWPSMSGIIQRGMSIYDEVAMGFKTKSNATNAKSKLLEKFPYAKIHIKKMTEKNFVNKYS